MEGPGGRGERSLKWTGPPDPPSFEGPILSLNWAVEAFADNGEISANCGFVLSPTRRDLQLKYGNVLPVST